MSDTLPKRPGIGRYGESGGKPAAAPFVIICRGLARTMSCPFNGQYLKSYDPNGDEAAGLGAWTRDIAEAKLFDSRKAAIDEYMAIRTLDPVRRDGQPNRPLTAFTVEISSRDFAAQLETKR